MTFSKFELLPMQANKEGGLFDVPDVTDKHGNLIIATMKLVRSRLLKLVARSVFLALIVLFAFRFPAIRTILADPMSMLNQDTKQDYPAKLATLFRDLKNEGLLKAGPDHKALFWTSNNIVSGEGEFLNGMDVVSEDDWNSVPNESLDFALGSLSGSNSALEFIDRTIKVGGIAVFEVTNGHDFPSLLGLMNPANYKIVYLRRFQSYLLLAMRKTGRPIPDDGANRRHLLDQYSTATETQRKAALDKLEDVLLEPPRAASRKSRQYFKRTRYLPDLIGDSLESYPRRVFIDVGLPEKVGGGSGTEWFVKHYPKRNLHFKMYKIETMAAEQEADDDQDISNKEEDHEADIVGVSDWLKKNIKEEEYVVMKAEAETAEEMMKSGVLRLVDELFLECKPRGHEVGSRRMGRAYWECLALYGRLRDEGVAVHQWWG